MLSFVLSLREFHHHIMLFSSSVHFSSQFEEFSSHSKESSTTLHEDSSTLNFLLYQRNILFIDYLENSSSGGFPFLSDGFIFKF